ncbi:MAG: polysaccharide deacetylase family protein [Desulfotalea sp.]
MPYQTSPIYRASIDFNSRRNEIQASIQRGCKNGSNVFFRADDIAVPSDKYSQLMAIFQRHQLPLALALVPTWLSEKRWNDILEIAGNNTLWCWHQHGRLHRNFEPTGKKYEFGPSRKNEELELHLLRGKMTLEKFVGSRLSPLFTPPWNRCSELTLHYLVKHGFKAISRSRGAKPKSPHNLPDLQVNVDLHTRREENAEKCFQDLLMELEKSLQEPLCGIMIHHQCMNKNAFLLLEILLEELKNKEGISFINLKSYL